MWICFILAYYLQTDRRDNYNNDLPKLLRSLYSLASGIFDILVEIGNAFSLTVILLNNSFIFGSVFHFYGHSLIIIMYYLVGSAIYRSINAFSYYLFIYMGKVYAVVIPVDGTAGY